MASERWRRIEQLYLLALERDAVSRAAFVAQACAGDEALRQEVESLLAAGEGADDYLETPALEVAAHVRAQDEARRNLAGREIDSLPPTQTMAPPHLPARLGRYQITGEIGKGGMGTVYQGIDPMIGRTVAVKTILQDRLGSPKEAAKLGERLMREARAAGGLAHPNIVTVFDAGEEAGVRYIVMELIRGSTLDAMLPANGTPVPTERALAILAEAAAALDFAHGRNVVHRDVKPANIMIQTDGTVKLADFGIARLANATAFTMAGHAPGSPCFMSPEQLRGEEASPRSDQYSLAVVAWILLTGSKPFDDGQLMLLIGKILEEEPPGSSYLCPAADGVLRRALAKNPQARFESCSAFVAALAEACIRKPPASLPPAPPKRRGILTAAEVLACILLVAVILWLLLRQQPQPGRPGLRASATGPIVPLPPADGQPKASPPGQQAPPSLPPAAGPSASGGKPAGKGPPPADRPVPGVVPPSPSDAPAPVSPPSSPADAAPTGADARPQPSGPHEPRINPADGLTYVWIPPGTFQMGCSPEDTECFKPEKPPHQVTISKGFWIGRTEVPQAAYQRVTGKNPGGARAAKRPVSYVTWDDAQIYCQAIGMRLPTEAEWEYAARAGSTGSRYGDLDQIAWFEGNSGNQKRDVASKQANAWGLHDMLGNVAEWVADWYEPYYRPGSVTDPQGPPAGEFRAIRGGNWIDNPRLTRVSRRHGEVPSHAGPGLGFRCAGN